MPSDLGPEAPAVAAGNPSSRARTRRGQLRLAGLLHPFRRGVLEPVIDTATLERRLAPILGLGSITSRVPLPAAAHQLSVGWIGPHRIAAWVGSAIEIVAAPEHPPTLWLLQGGWLECQAGSGPQPLQPGWLFYAGADAYRLRSGVCSVVAIAFAEGRLETQLRQLAASGGVLEAGALLKRPLLAGPAGAPWGGLVAAMGPLLSLYEQLEAMEPNLVSRMELDQLLERLLAGLLLAASGGVEALDLASPASTITAQDEAFEALLVCIRSGLAQPLNLSLLESWTQRPRRELQMVFRERLGCTPMQWIRRERLNQARRRLEHPQPGDTVAAIARECGYGSAARFSADFRREFLCAPSCLLRAAAKSPAPADEATGTSRLSRDAIASSGHAPALSRW